MKKLIACAVFAAMTLVSAMALAAGPSFTGPWKSAKDGKFYFNVKAGNGKVIMQSEGYSSLQKAMQGRNSVLANGRYPGAYKVARAANGQYYYYLKAVNARVVGVGETYTRRPDAYRGVRAAVSVLNEIWRGLKAGAVR